MHSDDDEFPAKVPNDLSSASFHPLALFNGSRGVGGKTKQVPLNMQDMT